MKTDVGGTLGILWPNMVETFGNGQSFDTFQGFATHSKLMRLLVPQLQYLPNDPIFKHQEDFDQAPT